MSNPFHSGSPVTGDAFGDRTTETDFLVSRMLRKQNVFLMSPRRYGKTSLLLRAVGDARRRGARVGMANLFYASDRREVAEHLTRAVIDGALGWLVGTTEQIGERLRRIPWVTPILERDGWQVALALSGRDPSFLDAIRRPVELLADSARDGHPVCLVVDEFQQVAEIDSALPGVWKAIADDLPQVSLVLCGSRRHVMTRLFTGAGAPLQHIAEPLSLEVIPRAEMVDFVRARSAAAGREMDSGAAILLYDLMRGIPHFVQLLAASAFDEGEGPIDGDCVRRGLVALLLRQRGELALRYEGLASGQRRLLRALAREPVRELTGHEFLGRAGLPASSVQRARSALDESEVITYDERVGWCVADPVLERWLRHAVELDLGEPLSPDSIV